MKTENIRARLEMQESGLDHQMYGIRDVMPLDVDTIMAIVEDEAAKDQERYTEEELEQQLNRCESSLSSVLGYLNGINENNHIVEALHYLQHEVLILRNKIDKLEGRNQYD